MSQLLDTSEIQLFTSTFDENWGCTIYYWVQVLILVYKDLLGYGIPISL